MKAKFVIPLVLFVALVLLLAYGLTRDPREVPSPLIGKPAPAFSLPSLTEPGKTVGTADYRGRVWLLNVWATWCISCRAEHPNLVAFARQGVVPIVGLDWKDDSDAARQWLAQLGDPYDTVAVDADGRVAIDWGVYGAPETYLIDRQGIIRHKHIGPLTPEVIRDELLPLIRKYQKGASS